MYLFSYKVFWFSGFQGVWGGTAGWRTTFRQACNWHQLYWPLSLLYCNRWQCRSVAMQAWNRHHQNCNNCIELCGTVDYILLQFHTKCFNTKCRELNGRCDIGDWCLLHPHKGSTLNWPVTDPLDQTEMYQQQCRCNGPRGCVSSGVTKEAFVLVCFDALPPLWTIPKVMFCCIVPCLGVYYGCFYPEASSWTKHS